MLKIIATTSKLIAHANLLKYCNCFKILLPIVHDFTCSLSSEMSIHCHCLLPSNLQMTLGLFCLLSFFLLEGRFQSSFRCRRLSWTRAGYSSAIYYCPAIIHWCGCDSGMIMLLMMAFYILGYFIFILMVLANDSKLVVLVGMTWRYAKNI